jgi:hypothetical protein
VAVYQAMMIRRSLPFLLLACVLCSTAVQAQTVTSVRVGRSNGNVQTSAAPPVIDPAPATPTYGGPFGFEVSVQGTGLSAIPAPTFTAPAGAGILSPVPTCGGFFNPAVYNGGVLGYNALESAWNMGAPNFNNFGGMNGGQRNCLFLSPPAGTGTYTVNVLGTPVTLTLGPIASFIPNPHFTLSGGSWSGGKYVIDVNDTLTVTSNSFPGYSQHADGAIHLGIAGPGGVLVDDLRFYSDNPAAPDSISYSLAPGSLTSGDDYDVAGMFAAVLDKSSGLAGLPASLNIGYFSISTSLVVSAVGVLADTTAPVITSVSTSTASLWPANHKMVPVTVSATATDAVGPVTLSILSVASSEPDNGLGDGDTDGDIVITGPMTVNLRAERSGKGPGRVYAITVEAEDGAGNTSTAIVNVTVAKSQGK